MQDFIPLTLRSCFPKYYSIHTLQHSNSILIYFLCPYVLQYPFKPKESNLFNISVVKYIFRLTSLELIMTYRNINW